MQILFIEIDNKINDILNSNNINKHHILNELKCDKQIYFEYFSTENGININNIIDLSKDVVTFNKKFNNLKEVYEEFKFLYKSNINNYIDVDIIKNITVYNYFDILYIPGGDGNHRLCILKLLYHLGFIEKNINIKYVEHFTVNNLYIQFDRISKIIKINKFFF